MATQILLYAASLKLVGFGNQRKVASFFGHIQYKVEEMYELTNKLKKLN